MIKLSREFIYINLTGPTASYRLPTAISGTQLALETPTYSAILGMLSYATGREIGIEDTQIGFRYKYRGSGMDLEKIHRWKRTKSGNYTYDDTNIRKRQIHYNIKLEIILDNTNLFDELQNPNRQLTFGRSQDLATTETVEIINGNSIDMTQLSGTLLPVDNVGADIPGSGMFYNLPEYFQYYEGKTRRARNVRPFLALDQYPQEIEFSNLYQLDGKSGFYLHEWRK